MKIKSLSVIAFLMLFLGQFANAQVKIGYTNIEVVLAYMPESKSLETALMTFEKKLSEKIRIKDDYLKQKYNEYLMLKERGITPEEDERRQKELLALDEEIQKLAAEAEFELMAKRQELLEPILKKLQDAIDAVAAEDGYTYILNQTTSAGVSTILFGPEENDITEKLFKKLGINPPQE